MNTSEREKFLSSFKEMKERHSGVFSAPAEWYDRCERVHAKMEILSNPFTEVKVQLEKTDNEHVPEDDIYPIASKIDYYIPRYFSTYSMLPSHMIYPTIPAGMKQGGMGWGKHINTYMTRNNVSEENKKEVSKLLSKAGEVYAKFKTSKDTYYVYFMYSPQAFALLGHYSVDSGSCFRTGGLNEIHKFMIGQTQDSFVGMISKNRLANDNIECLLSFAPTMRFWGVLDSNSKIFNICNFYPRNPSEQGNVYKSINESIKTLIGESVGEAPGRFRATGIYCNPESPVVYHPKSVEIGEETIIIPMNDKNLNKYRKCLKCGRQATSEDDVHQQIDYSHYCGTCAAKCVYVCELSGQKTMGELYNAYRQGKVIRVSKVSLNDHFRMCNGRYHHIDDLVKVKNSYKLKDSLKNKVSV